MRYLTDRKRAMGKGAAHTGTEHHWSMTVSAVALAFLVPGFLFVFGRALGQDHASVVEIFGRPFPALIAGMTLFVGMRHFAKGAQTMIEDYLHGSLGKMAIIFVTCLSYTTIAIGLFALAKMAL